MSSAVMFRLARSKLAQRFDPRANQPLVRQLRNRLNAGKYPATQLHDLADFTKSTVTEIGSEDVYVGLENIDGVAGEYLATKDKESISSAAVFKRGDILFPKLRPYLNKTHLAQFDGLCSTEFHVLKIHGAIPEYVAAILRSESMVQLTAQLMTGNTLPRLQTADIENLAIPLPSVAVQQQVVDLIQQAYAEKKRLEDAANELLAGVDDLVCKHLKIRPPTVVLSSLANRTFIRKQSELEGRLNPSFYLPKFQNWHTAMSLSPYSSLRLGQLNVRIFQGVGRNIDELSEVTLLKVKNISLDGTISYENVEPVGDVPIQKLLLRGDIVAPFIGEAMRLYKFAQFQGEENLFTVDNNTGVIRVSDDRLLSEYLYCFCQTNLIRWQIDQLIGGGGVPFLGSESAKLIKVCVPPLEVQRLVISDYQALRQRASALYIQANEYLNKAKSKIEKMILGEPE